MQRIKLRAAAAAFIAAASLPFGMDATGGHATVVAGRAPLHAAAAVSAVDVARQGLQRAAAKASAGDLKGASSELEALLRHPGFTQLTAKDQRNAVFLAAVVALDLEQDERAHELLVRSCAMEGATGEDWRHRLFAAQILDKDADAVTSLTTIARSWPDEFEHIADQSVYRVLSKSGELPTASARFDLLEALFQAGWRTEEEEEPSDLWSELASELLERGKLQRAVEVSGRVMDPHELIGMLVDKRFAGVVAATPRRFDIDAAAAAEIAGRRQRMTDQPKLLGPRVQLMYSLIDSNQPAEVLTLADEAIARAAAGKADATVYEDADDQLVWILDNRARALYALGRHADAVEQMERARRMAENGGQNVSQSINLGFLYGLLGRPKDARAAIAEVTEVSPYGRMQLETVRLIAALEANDAGEAARSLAYLAEHRDDSIETYQYALVHAALIEDAASLLIERLADPKLRSSALSSVQSYIVLPAPQRRQKWEATWNAIIARADVQAGLAKVGKIERFNLLPPSYY